MDEFLKSENYYIHAYGRHKVILDHGEGVYLYDTDGKKYLDFYSGIGVNGLGYNHPAYTKALHEQIDKVLHVSNYFYSSASGDAAKAVCEATGLDKVFFCNSGAEATEGALKLARKAYFNKNKKADSQIIAFHNSFHGRTTGSVRLTGNTHYQEAFGPLMEGVVYADINDIESVKRLINDHTVAIIVEPVQGEGGVTACSETFLKELRQLCDDNDIALIFDEVQCGMGRTGTMMTYQRYGIQPDILCLAKAIGCGVPVGAFVANEKYASAMVPGDHGSTYGGNPFVCAAVKAVFEIYEEEHIVEHAKEMGEYLDKYLQSLLELDCVESLRGLGLMRGIVLNKPVKELLNTLLDQGLIVISAGENIVRLLPPLVITKEEIDEGMTLLRKALEAY